MNFKEELSLHVDGIENILQAYLPVVQGFQKNLVSAVHYGMSGGGKRIRPLLMQETYRLFGGSSPVIEPFMAAIEMIHSHSLIHDDLPALDNDEYRRGRKTTHIVFGEAMGILAGDALLNLAYETAAKAFLMEPENGNLGRAFGILAGKSGIYGMIGGQSVDVEAAGEALPGEKLEFIYRLKTSALIESAMMIGAVLGGASDREIELVEGIAADVGLAFQIQDDILDVLSSTEVLGKPVLSDERNHKTTYVTLNGLKQAKAEVEFISRRAIGTLDSLKISNEFLRNVILSLIHREK